jgi:molybdenum cofactor synthesis domain-containing protein
MENLAKYDLHFDHYEIIPDDAILIRQKANEAAAKGVHLLLFCGGTGMSKTDVTPDALKELITIPIPGIMEVARAYGQARMPFAMLSRGVAGMINDTLVITLPGSYRGANETIDAIFPHVLHLFNMLAGDTH